MNAIEKIIAVTYTVSDRIFLRHNICDIISEKIIQIL